MVSNKDYICGVPSRLTAVIRECEPLMLEEGDWAYERLLLSGAMNAPSSLLGRFLFRSRDRGHMEERARLRLPAAEPSGKFQRTARIGMDPILPPRHSQQLTHSS